MAQGACAHRTLPAAQHQMTRPIEQVIDQHRVTYHSVDALVFEPTQVDKILVSFTGMQIGHYNRWSWFCDRYQQDNTLYIVFKDDDRLFYLDREPQNPVSTHHADFILDKLAKHQLDSKKLYTLGTSMGGYSAIYFAFRLDAYAAITSSPLVDIDSATPTVNPNTDVLEPTTNLWSRQMAALGNTWIDLDQYVLQSAATPRIFLTHGTYRPDLAAVTKLTAALKEKNISYIIDQVDKNEHADYLSAATLFDLINHWPDK